MGEWLAGMSWTGLATIDVLGWAHTAWGLLQVIIGFSAIIFVHELGHFAMAKWAGVRVEKFCIGFGKELFGFTRGETRYGFNLLPLGGYVKMMGQEDFEIDKSGEISVKDDPRAFSNKPVGHRMLIVSAGVIMNVIFAAILFMIVFMIGIEAPVTQVGYVKPGSPAQEAGFLPGDIVRRIDGSTINDFPELRMAVFLAEPHKALQFEVERKGERVHLEAVPINDKERDVLSVGIGPAVTGKIEAVAQEFDPEREDHPRPDDVIVSVDGKQVTDENANEMMYRIMSQPGLARRVEVERKSEEDGLPAKRVQITLLPHLTLQPSDPSNPDTANVLGLSPLVGVGAVQPEGRAAEAGLMENDIILRWGTVDYPTRTQITEIVRSHPETDIPVEVLREDGQIHLLTIRPFKSGNWFKRKDVPTIGASFDRIADHLPRVGNTILKVDGRPPPAAQASVPAGALILAVGDQPVANWHDLVEAFRAHAGRTVPLRLTERDGTPTTVEFRVPHCVRTLLGLPVHSRIESVNGKTNVELEVQQRRRSASVNYHAGLREALRTHIGKRVEVVYSEDNFSERKTAMINVTEDMIDPWLGRVGYEIGVILGPRSAKLQTSNPVTALGIGIKKTVYFVLNVYSTMQRMIVSRSVGVDKLSGPVGIIKMGTDSAKAGLPQLLFLLAILSANLAVINFLPLPIVDGGLMIFLIIEKIKGTPVSIKTQMVTQAIGLALIVLAFVFITFQDVLKIAGGSM